MTFQTTTTSRLHSEVSIKLIIWIDLIFVNKELVTYFGLIMKYVTETDTKCKNKYISRIFFKKRTSFYLIPKVPDKKKQKQNMIQSNKIFSNDARNGFAADSKC